jgi:hypothetical protein
MLATIYIRIGNAQTYCKLVDGVYYTLILFTMLDKLIMIYICNGNAQIYCLLVDGDFCTLNLLTMLVESVASFECFFSFWFLVILFLLA